MEKINAKIHLLDIDNRRHIEVEEVAKILGITRKGVFYLINKGELTPLVYKVGKKDKFYFNKEEIDKIKKSRRERTKYQTESKFKRIVSKTLNNSIDKGIELDTDNKEVLNNKRIDELGSKIYKNTEISKTENKALTDIIQTFNKALDNNTKALEIQSRVIEELLTENRKIKEENQRLTGQYIATPKIGIGEKKSLASIFKSIFK